MKNAFIITDVKILRASLDFARNLGLTVDQDNYSREENEAISIGTSKKYDVGGNQDPSFYSRKHNITPVDLNKETVSAFIQSVLDLYVEEEKKTEVDPDDFEDDDVIQDDYENNNDKYNHDAINLLVSKVKQNKKSIKSYFVIEDTITKEYSLTVYSSKEGVIGNLYEIFNEINAD